PQRDAAPADTPRVCRIHKGAPTGCQNVNRPGEQPSDDPALAVAEHPLAAVGKNFLDGLAGSCLDLVIRIEERKAEACCEPPADIGLPGPHQPDQHDGSARRNPSCCRSLPPRLSRTDLHRTPSAAAALFPRAREGY